MDISTPKFMESCADESKDLDAEDVAGPLPEGHPFAWETIQVDPKGVHPSVSMRKYWYKTMTYSVLDTNGFLLLYTMRGRVYWVTQNLSTHTTPDWKIHFSVRPEDISVAWNVIAGLFMERKCDIGMKATTAGAKFSSGGQRGREITVYIYVYDAKLRHGIMYQSDDDVGPEKFIGTDVQNYGSRHHDDHLVESSPIYAESDFYLGQEFDGIYSPQFWYSFIAEAERRLARSGVRNSLGPATGDLPLPHCHYASLRNESFVTEIDPETGERTALQYPSNAASWNAAGHRNPLEETIYQLLLYPPHQQP